MKKLSVNDLHKSLKNSLGEEFTMSEFDFANELTSNEGYRDVVLNQIVPAIDSEYTPDLVREMEEDLKKKDLPTPSLDGSGESGATTSPLETDPPKKKPRAQYFPWESEPELGAKTPQQLIERQRLIERVDAEMEVFRANFIDTIPESGLETVVDHWYAAFGKETLGEFYDKAHDRDDNIARGVLEQRAINQGLRYTDIAFKTEFPNGLPDHVEQGLAISKAVRKRLYMIEAHEVITAYIEEPSAMNRMKAYQIAGVDNDEDMNAFYEANADAILELDENINHISVEQPLYEVEVGPAAQAPDVSKRIPNIGWEGSIAEAFEKIKEISNTPAWETMTKIERARGYFIESLDDMAVNYPEHAERMATEMRLQQEADNFMQDMENAPALVRGMFRLSKPFVRAGGTVAHGIFELPKTVHKLFGGDTPEAYDAILDAIQVDRYYTTRVSSKGQRIGFEYLLDLGDGYTAVYNGQSDNDGTLQYFVNENGFMVHDPITVGKLTARADKLTAEGARYEYDYHWYSGATQGTQAFVDVMALMAGGEISAGSKIVRAGASRGLKLSDFVRRGLGLKRTPITTSRVSSAARGWGSTGTMYMQMHHSMYNEALMNGMTSREAENYAVGSAMAVALINRINPEYRLVHNPRSVISKADIRSMMRGLSDREVLKQGFRNTLQRAKVHGKKALGEAVEERYLERMGQAAWGEIMQRSTEKDLALPEQDIFSTKDMQEFAIGGIIGGGMSVTSDAKAYSSASSLHKDLMYRAYLEQDETFKLIRESEGMLVPDKEGNLVPLTREQAEETIGDLDAAFKEMDAFVENAELEYKAFFEEAHKMELLQEFLYKGGIKGDDDLSVKMREDIDAKLESMAMDPSIIDETYTDAKHDAYADAKASQKKQELESDVNTLLGNKNTDQSPPQLRSLGKMLEDNFNVPIFTDKEAFRAHLLSLGVEPDGVDAYRGVYDASRNHIFINPDKATLGTPIHEYGHIWVNYVKENNRELYDRVISLVEQSPELMALVDGDPVYQGQEAMEALVIAIEKRGEEIISDPSLLKKIQDALAELFEYLAKAFNIETTDFANMTLEQFVDHGAYEVLTGDFKIGGTIESLPAQSTAIETNVGKVVNTLTTGGRVEGPLGKNADGDFIIKSEVGDVVVAQANQNGMALGDLGVLLTETEGRVKIVPSVKEDGTSERLVEIDGRLHVVTQEDLVRDSQGNAYGLVLADKETGQEAFFSMDNEITQEITRKAMNGNYFSKVGSSEVFQLGIAPFRAREVSSMEDFNEALETEQYKFMTNTINGLAGGLDLTIHEATPTVGGWYSDKKNKFINEPSRLITVQGNREDAEVMAAVMGILAPEQQESVMLLRIGEDVEHMAADGLLDWDPELGWHAMPETLWSNSADSPQEFMLSLLTEHFDEKRITSRGLTINEEAERIEGEYGSMPWMLEFSKEDGAIEFGAFGVASPTFELLSQESVEEADKKQAELAAAFLAPYRTLTNLGIPFRIKVPDNATTEQLNTFIKRLGQFEKSLYGKNTIFVASSGFGLRAFMQPSLIGSFKSLDQGLLLVLELEDDVDDRVANAAEVAKNLGVEGYSFDPSSNKLHIFTEGNEQTSKILSRLDPSSFKEISYAKVSPKFKPEYTQAKDDQGHRRRVELGYLETIREYRSKRPNLRTERPDVDNALSIAEEAYVRDEAHRWDNRAIINEPIKIEWNEAKSDYMVGGMTMKQYGFRYGLETFGGVRPRVATHMGGGVYWDIPGGLDTEGSFTYAELIWMKEQGWNPNDITDEFIRTALYRKLARTHTRPHEGRDKDEKFDWSETIDTDPIDTFNRYIFGLLSPNQPLTPNEFQVAAMRVQGMEDEHSDNLIKKWFAGDLTAPAEQTGMHAPLPGSTIATGYKISIESPLEVQDSSFFFGAMKGEMAVGLSTDELFELSALTNDDVVRAYGLSAAISDLPQSMPLHQNYHITYDLSDGGTYTTHLNTDVLKVSDYSTYDFDMMDANGGIPIAIVSFSSYLSGEEVYDERVAETLKKHGYVEGSPASAIEAIMEYLGTLSPVQGAATANFNQVVEYAESTKVTLNSKEAPAEFKEADDAPRSRVPLGKAFLGDNTSSKGLNVSNGATVFFHGTNALFDKFERQEEAKGSGTDTWHLMKPRKGFPLFLSPNAYVAKAFSGKGGRVYEVSIDQDVKIFDPAKNGNLFGLIYEGSQTQGSPLSAMYATIESDVNALLVGGRTTLPHHVIASYAMARMSAYELDEMVKALQLPKEYVFDPQRLKRITPETAIAITRYAIENTKDNITGYAAEAVDELLHVSTDENLMAPDPSYDEEESLEVIDHGEHSYLKETWGQAQFGIILWDHAETKLEGPLKNFFEKIDREGIKFGKHYDEPFYESAIRHTEKLQMLRKFAENDFRLIEQPAIVDMLDEMGYDGFVVRESSVASANLAILNADKVQFKYKKPDGETALPSLRNAFTAQDMEKVTIQGLANMYPHESAETPLTAEEAKELRKKMNAFFGLQKSEAGPIEPDPQGFMDAMQERYPSHGLPGMFAITSDGKAPVYGPNQNILLLADLRMEEDGTIFIDHVMSPERQFAETGVTQKAKKGQGTKGMKALMKLADEFGVEVRLLAAPPTGNMMGGGRTRIKGVNKKVLEKFYRKFGFKKGADGYMTRVGKERIKKGVEGGLGLAGSADITNVARLAKMYVEDPTFFTKKKSETWVDFLERIQTQVQGLGSKTGSFAIVWQDPSTAAVSAMDRHMFRVFEKELFSDPEVKREFEDKIVSRWNAQVEKGESLKSAKQKVKYYRNKKTFVTPEARRADNLDEVMSQSAHGKVGALYMDEAFKSLGVKSVKYRYKSGEVNPDISVNLKGTKFVIEPKEVQTIGDNYMKMLAINEEKARQSGLSVFMAQWALWDKARNRFEPHEAMFPGLHKLPRMSFTNLKQSLAGHKDVGYLDSSKAEIQQKEGSASAKMKPVRKATPGSLMYFSKDPYSGLDMKQAKELVRKHRANGLSSDAIREALIRGGMDEHIADALVGVEFNPEDPTIAEKVRLGFLNFAGKLSTQTAEEITENARTYLPRSNKITTADAYLMLEKMGLEGVYDLLNNPTAMADERLAINNVPFADSEVRVVLTRIVAEEFDRIAEQMVLAEEHELAQEYRGYAAQVMDSLIPELTQKGRFIQAASILAKASGNYYVQYLNGRLRSRNFEALTDEDAEEIRRLHSAMRNAPEGLPQIEAEAALLKHVSKIMPIGLYEVLENQYYTNLLSGYGTNLKNAYGSFNQILFEGLTEAAASGNVRDMGAYYLGLLKGMIPALNVFRYIMGTGIQYGFTTRGKFDETKLAQGIPIYEYMSPNQFTGDGKFTSRWTKSENSVTRFMGHVSTGIGRAALTIFNPAVMKYFGRTLIGTDVAFATMSQSAQLELIKQRLKREGKFAPKELDAKAKELLFGRDLDREARYDGYSKRAEEEGYKVGTPSHRIRVFELARAEEVPDEVRLQMFRKGQEYTYNYDPEGILGFGYSALISSIERANKANETLGYFAQGAKTLFVPFARILVNVANRGYAYSPLGFLKQSAGFTTKLFGVNARKMEAGTMRWVDVNDYEKSLARARATIGTVVTMALYGMTMGGDDDDEENLPWVTITGAGPSNYSKRYQLAQKRAYKPFTITFNRNMVTGEVLPPHERRRIDYRDNMLFLTLAAIGTLRDHERFGDNTEAEGNRALATATTYVTSMLASISEQTYVQGLAGLFKEVQPSGYAAGEKNLETATEGIVKKVENYGLNTISGLAVPNIVKQMSRTGRGLSNRGIQQKVGSMENPEGYMKDIFRDAHMIDPDYPIMDHFGRPVVPTYDNYIPLLVQPAEEEQGVYRFFRENFLDENIFIPKHRFPEFINERGEVEPMTPEEEMAYFALRNAFIYDGLDELRFDPVFSEVSETIDIEGIEEEYPFATEERVQALAEKQQSKDLKAELARIVSDANDKAERYVEAMKFGLPFPTDFELPDYIVEDAPYRDELFKHLK